MPDERLNQHLETQLRNANATNHDLREQLAGVEHREQTARDIKAHGEIALRQLEKAHATQKSAEDKAAVARRKLEDAELQLVRARGEITELRERLTRVQREADRLHVLEDRIAKAKHAGDLFRP